MLTGDELRTAVLKYAAVNNQISGMKADVERLQDTANDTYARIHGIQPGALVWSCRRNRWVCVSYLLIPAGPQLPLYPDDPRTFMPTIYARSVRHDARGVPVKNKNGQWRLYGYTMLLCYGDYECRPYNF